jgi:hypothetical protein
MGRKTIEEAGRVSTVVASALDTLPDPRKAGGHPSLRGVRTGGILYRCAW